MKDLIANDELWDRLKETSLPLILYGMGNGADMIIDILESIGISFSDVFASDGFVRGQYFHEKKVLTLSEIESKYDDFIILMTFAVHDGKTLDFVRSLSRKYTLYSPTVPIVGSGLFTYDYICEHDSEFDKAYSLLSDERSRQTFLDVLSFKVSGKTDYLFRCQSEKSEVYENILKLTEHESIVDLGAYDADTIREFLSYTDGKYDIISAFEPDEKNFRKLEKKTDRLQRIARFNLGAWDKEETLFFQKKAGRNSRQDSTGIPVKFNSVDNIISHKVTLLKMDIEGAESKALDGARRTIEKYKPKLYVCVYHRNEDFFDLILKIHDICPDYKIYMRHHPYIPAWETNIYCTL